MKKLRFGIIGCSRIAESSVVPAILTSKHTELEMVGSRNIKKSKQFANKFKCNKFGNYDDVLENENVDIVYISTPVGLHEKWRQESLGWHFSVLYEFGRCLQKAKTLNEP